MTQHLSQPGNPESISASTLTHAPAPASKYEPPAIIHRGVLETRAGSPTSNLLNDLTDPDNPF